MIKINGIEVDTAGVSLATYVANAGYNPQRIAVERNGNIVPKSQYDTTMLQDGDTLEVVSFVGGG